MHCRAFLALRGWKSAGVLALLCSGVAWASLPRVTDIPTDEQHQWQALAIAPLSSGGATGMRMVADRRGRAARVRAEARCGRPAGRRSGCQRLRPSARGPLRISGRVGDGLYWSLRAAGASPEVAAQYLAALATQIDVGDVAPSASFDMVLGPNRELALRGAEPRRRAAPCSWCGGMPTAAASGSTPPTRPGRTRRKRHDDAGAAGRSPPISATAITRSCTSPASTRASISAPSWGSPIVAAGDGQVVAAGWAGGYGREVQIAHGGGLVSLYGHMSEIVAAPGSFVLARAS